MSTNHPPVRFKHDCERCHYLGHYNPTNLHDTDPFCDLYFCTGAVLPTVIARYGNDGPEYTSGLFEGLQDPALVLATVRALKAILAGEIPVRPKRKVQLYQDRHGTAHTAKFVDEPGKWEASNHGATEALGRLVISHPEIFNVELTETYDWSKR